MIKTPYRFEANLSDQEFQKIGQFACRWSLIEHTIGNCLRRLVNISLDDAAIIIFPLNLDSRMRRISDCIRARPLSKHQMALFSELKPLIKAMQFLRNNILHGIVVDNVGDEPFFHLRSKNRNISKAELFSCEDLINYAAHVTQAFRLSLGEKEDHREPTYALPDRPPIPEFLPKECRAFPPGSTGGPLARPVA
jgi:hypothetical protein